MPLECGTAAIVPEKFDLTFIIKAQEAELIRLAAKIKKDFDSTAETWDHKPAFTTRVTKDAIAVSTSDENWIRVDAGTQAKSGRILAPKKTGGKRYFRIVKRRPKTTPGRLRAAAGGATGEVVFRASRKQGAIAARNFTQQIVAKYESLAATSLQAAISSGAEVGVSDRGQEVKALGRVRST